METDRQRTASPGQGVGTTDALIRHLYIDRRHSDREIAEALGLSRVTVTRRRLAMGVRPSDRTPVVLPQ